MMAIPPSLKNLLSGASIETFIVVRIGEISCTSANVPVVIEGRTYTPSNTALRLVQIDPPSITASVDRASYTITLADPDMYFGEYLEGLNPGGHVTSIEGGYTGLPVEVRMGFFIGVQIATDNILLYKGVVDTGSYKMTLDEFGESLFIVSCSSPMGSLDMNRTLYTTKHDIRGINGKDAAFDQVYEGSSQIRFLWGKG